MAAKKKQPSIEQQFQELEEIIAQLEQEDTTLSDAVSGYSKGVALIKSCQKVLDDVEKQIVILSEEEEVEEADEE